MNFKDNYFKIKKLELNLLILKFKIIIISS
jgi:hypothetical protein